MAAAIAVSTSASTLGPELGMEVVTLCSRLTRSRSRERSTCSSFASPRTDVSSIPATPGGRAQANRDRDGLLIIEQQWRQRGTCPEAIAARHAWRSAYGVP